MRWSVLCVIQTRCTSGWVSICLTRFAISSSAPSCYNLQFTDYECICRYSLCSRKLTTRLYNCFDGVESGKKYAETVWQARMCPSLPKDYVFTINTMVTRNRTVGSRAQRWFNPSLRYRKLLVTRTRVPVEEGSTVRISRVSSAFSDGSLFQNSSACLGEFPSMFILINQLCVLVNMHATVHRFCLRVHGKCRERIHTYYHSS